MSNQTGWGVALFFLLVLGAFGGLDPCTEGTEASSLDSDPFDPSTNSYDFIDPDLGLPPASNCADGADNESPLADGTADQTDYDCFRLADSDGNGVCDMRVYMMGGVESTDQQFFTNFDSCSGFEGCVSDDTKNDYAATQGWVKSI